MPGLTRPTPGPRCVPSNLSRSAHRLEQYRRIKPISRSRRHERLTVFRYVAGRRFGLFATTTRTHSIIRTANPMPDGSEGTPMSSDDNCDIIGSVSYLGMDCEQVATYYLRLQGAVETAIQVQLYGSAERRLAPLDRSRPRSAYGATPRNLPGADELARGTRRRSQLDSLQRRGPVAMF